MRILVLTTTGFAPTHTSKLLAQVEYLNRFSDMDVSVKTDLGLADIEYLIMTQNYDCVYPTTVFEYSNDKQEIISFNRKLYQILEYHQQPYIGSELFVHMLLNDKALTNYRCAMSLPNILLTRELWTQKYSQAVNYINKAPLPVIVKPNTLAASLGISDASIAYTKEELLSIIDYQFNTFLNVNELLLEHYLSNAREFTVSVTGNKDKVLCSATALISRTEKYEMFSFVNKNLLADKRTVEYSSQIAEPLKKRLKEKALELSRILNVRDYSRYDFLMDDQEKIYLIDANSLPSLGSNFLLEYVNQGLIREEQILSLLLTVFCKRTNYVYPQHINKLSEQILKDIL